MAANPTSNTETISASDILVVTANLAETHNPLDVAETGDMKAFAVRVDKLLPRPPDVILLQEVFVPSAEAVVKYLKQTTGAAYSIAVEPASKSPRTADKTRDYVRDTAVLLNNNTTKATGRKGILTTGYDPRHLNPTWQTGLVRMKEHGHVLALHKPSRTRLALMSIHLAPNAAVTPEERFFQYTEEWVGQMCADMKKNYPRRGRQINILAGDFNNRRCVDKKETVTGEVMPMWARLQKEGYKDAVFEIHGKDDKTLTKQYEKGGAKKVKRIDYIFVSGGDVVDASFDLSDPSAYSDHRLLWAVVRPAAKRAKGS